MGTSSLIVGWHHHSHCVQEPIHFYSWLEWYCTVQQVHLHCQFQTHLWCMHTPECVEKSKTSCTAPTHLHLLNFNWCSCLFLASATMQIMLFISRTTRNSILQHHFYVNIFQEPSTKFLLCRIHGTTVARSWKEWLGISACPPLLFMISPTADSWFFSPYRVLKEVK